MTKKCQKNHKVQGEETTSERENKINEQKKALHGAYIASRKGGDLFLFTHLLVRCVRFIYLPHG